MDDKEKTSNIIIRISQDQKERFMQLCKQKDINSSALIRRLIEQWIQDQLNNDIEKKRTTDI